MRQPRVSLGDGIPRGEEEVSGDSSGWQCWGGGLETEEVPSVCEGSRRKLENKTNVWGNGGEGGTEKRCGQREREEHPVGRAAFSESRGNSIGQGILKGEHSRNGPRLSVECTWCHCIEPAHTADFHIRNHSGGQSTVPASPSPSPLQQAAYGLPAVPVCVHVENQHPATSFPLWSSQGCCWSWRQRAWAGHVFLALVLTGWARDPARGSLGLRTSLGGSVMGGCWGWASTIMS